MRKYNKIFIKYIFLTLWSIACIFPIYWLITFSLKSNSEIYGENIVGLPQTWQFYNYKSAFMNGNVGTYFFNSIYVTFFTILITLLVAIPASYALKRMKWKFRNPTMVVLMIGIMVPIHSALLPVFKMMSKLNLINTRWSLIIPYVAFALPIAILIFTSFLASIPKELEEAACIDGANIFQMFIRIIVPLLKPAIATVSIFTFLQAWNELMFASVFISDNAIKTLTVGIQSMSGQYLTEWGPIGATLVVATVPTLIIYFLLSKQVQKGLLAGAIKG